MKKTAQDFVGLQFILFAVYVYEWLQRVQVTAALTVAGWVFSAMGVAIAAAALLSEIHLRGKAAHKEIYHLCVLPQEDRKIFPKIILSSIADLSGRTVLRI
ncbi:hypothetical protein [Kaistella sp.]|uniref:hypothetical protein n=1 Tax=Kaistella sp. TaxID=2782235 RepID=UPI002F928A05